jgi:hypothetical protein
MVADGALIARWGLSAEREGRYTRVEPGNPQDSRPPPAAGIFFNEELGARAAITAGDSGAAEIVIGLAAPRTLVRARGALWRSVSSGSPGGGGPVTVRVADDGSALLVSAPGARRVRFDRIRGAVGDPTMMRGLRGAK